MIRFLANPRGWFCLLLALIALALSGCATTDSDNESVRPWNSPKSWETGGLPSSLNEGR